MTKYTAIIPSAGSSTRFKQDKLILKINGEMVIKHVVNLFNDDKECIKIILVVKSDKYDFYKKLFCLFKKVIVISADTMSRSDSVAIGLNYCKNDKYVLIHDGCRPFVTHNLIETIKNNLYKYDAIVPIIKINDSIIKDNNNNNNIEYLNRDQIKRVQTPQAFNTRILIDAFKKNKSNIKFNDEFSLLLAQNKSVNYLLIDGEVNNIKITEPEDINIDI